MHKLISSQPRTQVIKGRRFSKVGPMFDPTEGLYPSETFITRQFRKNQTPPASSTPLTTVLTSHEAFCTQFFGGYCSPPYHSAYVPTLFDAIKSFNAPLPFFENIGLFLSPTSCQQLQTILDYASYHHLDITQIFGAYAKLQNNVTPTTSFSDQVINNCAPYMLTKGTLTRHGHEDHYRPITQTRQLLAAPTNAVIDYHAHRGNTVVACIAMGGLATGTCCLGSLESVATGFYSATTNPIGWVGGVLIGLGASLTTSSIAPGVVAASIGSALCSYACTGHFNITETCFPSVDRYFCSVPDPLTHLVRKDYSGIVISQELPQLIVDTFTQLHLVECARQNVGLTGRAHINGQFLRRVSPERLRFIAQIKLDLTASDTPVSDCFFGSLCSVQPEQLLTTTLEKAPSVGLFSQILSGSRYLHQCALEVDIYTYFLQQLPQLPGPDPKHINDFFIGITKLSNSLAIHLRSPSTMPPSTYKQIVDFLLFEDNLPRILNHIPLTLPNSKSHDYTYLVSDLCTLSGAPRPIDDAFRAALGFTPSERMDYFCATRDFTPQLKQVFYRFASYFGLHNTFSDIMPLFQHISAYHGERILKLTLDPQKAGLFFQISSLALRLLDAQDPRIFTPYFARCDEDPTITHENKRPILDLSPFSLDSARCAEEPAPTNYKNREGFPLRSLYCWIIQDVIRIVSSKHSRQYTTLEEAMSNYFGETWAQRYLDPTILKVFSDTRLSFDSITLKAVRDRPCATLTETADYLETHLKTLDVVLKRQVQKEKETITRISGTQGPGHSIPGMAEAGLVHDWTPDYEGVGNRQTNEEERAEEFRSLRQRASHENVDRDIQVLRERGRELDLRPRRLLSAHT